MRKTLKAKEGSIYTNGTVYGSTIHLADGVSDEGYYLITEEEYNERMAEQNEVDVT